MVRSPEELLEALANDVRWATHGPRAFTPQDAMAEIETRCRRREPGFVEPLIKALDHPSAFVRLAAANGLGYLGNWTATESLVARLSDEDRVVRRLAAGALGLIRDPSALESLVRALQDDDPRVRRRVAISMGQLGHRGAVEPLVAALTDKDRAVRQRAAEALGHVGDDRATAPLGTLVGQSREHWRVRRAAARALGKIGPLSRAVLLDEARHDPQVHGWLPRRMKALLDSP